jgi:hypothetical protein
MATGDANTFALVSNVVTGIATRPTYQYIGFGGMTDLNSGYTTTYNYLLKLTKADGTPLLYSDIETFTILMDNGNGTNLDFTHIFEETKEPYAAAVGATTTTWHGNGKVEVTALADGTALSDHATNTYIAFYFKLNDPTTIIDGASLTLHRSDKGQWKNAKAFGTNTDPSTFSSPHTPTDWIELTEVTTVDAPLGAWNGGTNPSEPWTSLGATQDVNQSALDATLIPSLTYDTSNKLSITGITPTSTTLTDPNGSSLDIGTVTDVYIRDSGKYAIASKDANTFLLASNTVTGTPTGTYDKRVPLAFHHGTFGDSGDPYGDGSVTVAATNGHVFADTAPGTYTWGTLGSASNTTTNSTYTWTPTSDITGSDVLMVAGGGGGGKQVGGGGGAGGLLHYTNQSLSGQKTIVVGNGGIGGDYGNGTTAYSGNNTTFTGLDDAIGGGHGVSYNGIAGSTGGSGGGGGGGSTNGYAGTTGQGNAGGSGYDSSWAGGGGGGAGGVGQNSSANTGGVGGVGVDKSSVFGTTYGVSGWFAGGGGGCSQTGTGGGAGGQGGGGRGGNNAGTAEGVREKGVDHTGGGGGGSRDGKGGSPTSLDPYGYETGDGGNGGSGIVLMMLPITATTPSQTYDTTKTITVSNVPAGTSTVGNIYKGSTAYPIHATTSTSNVIIKNTGTYLSVFTTATQAFLTNAIDVSTQPTATSEDNTIEDEAPLSASVSATLVFHHDTFANSDDPHGDGSITTAATNGHVYSDTPTGTYSWGTLGSATLNQPSGTDTSAGSGGHTPGNTTYTWTPPGTITGARMLLVGGGGGGGMNMGGGGGAGGFLAIASKDISASEQTVVVGRGGIGAPGQNQTNILGQQQGSDNNSYNTPAYNGGDSSISGETAYGGGRGGYSHNNDDRQHGGNGGSGGGVSGYGSGGRNNPGGTGVSGQGNTGGSSNTSHYSGGGGGAGEAGASANSEPKGGDGLSSDILGTEYWWSGGGGGGGYTINGGDGGKGGGGGGAVGTNPGGTGGLTAGGAGGGGSTNIQTNTPGGHAGKHTGGGGGGGAHYQGNNYGGNGGSGIVILKFVAQDADLAGSTAVPDQTTTIVIGEEAPSETLDVSTTTIQEPTLNLDFTVATTKLARNVKRYNGLSNSSIGARFNRRESRKKRIEKSISIPSSFSAELTANNASSPTTLTVTVSNSRFYINGESKPTLGFIRGETYTFDQSDSSNSGHPLVLATSKDGVQYTTGWVNNVFTVPYDVPDTIYYKCSNHNNMGGEIHTTFGTAFSLGDFDIAANTHVSGEYTLAVNYDGTTSNLYVNGSLITQTTPTISVGTKEFILGKEFDGYVKNFKFWNYAKSFLVLHATGGTITYITGYVVHTFTSSGNFVTPSGRDVEYLVVAGGGGGGFGHAGGGGGAGGFVDGSVTVSTGTFPVVVGTGGAGSTVASVKGGYGTNSSFNGIIGLGGGGGGSRNTSNATNGGSGGGGSRVSGTAGSATQPSSSSSGYGNNGGTGAGGGSGGGGAGGVGENGGDEGTVSVGGVGKISTISGNSLYYAAGGGGGTGAGVSDYAAPASGIGGRGGSLSASGSLLNGQVNTGSGGGGAGNNVAGGDGGSGIVIIRYIA